jgi:D-3-phosphoglycerate dehydrogenase
MRRALVLVTGTTLVPDDVVALAGERGFDVRRVRQDVFTDDELSAALDGVSGYLVGGYEEPTAEHLDAAKSLEVLGWVGTDFRAYVPGWRRAFEVGIAVVNSPGTNAVSVAEFTVRLALTLARPFPSVDQPDAEPEPGVELMGRTLGILGAGRIGAHVSRIAGAGLGMRVLYHAPRRNGAFEAATGTTYVPWERLLDESDVLSLHRPGPAPGEPYVLDRPAFERVREGLVLLDTVHPALVDPTALAWAIRARGVRAAFDADPAGDAVRPLLALAAEPDVGPGRLLVVPQSGFRTHDANLRTATVAMTATLDVLEGRPSEYVNNPDYLERRAAR